MAPKWQQQQRCIRLPVSLLKELNSTISLDRGCSSTKMVFVRREQESDDEFEIVCCLAPNAEFEEALRWLREQTKGLSLLSEEPQVALTGGGGAIYVQRISEILQAKPIYVDELVGQAKACAWLLRHARPSDVFFDDEFLTPLSEPVTLPGLYVFSGSGNGLVLVYPDGSKCQDHIMMHGGKSFMGYGAMLLGAGNYDEILALAELGDRERVLANECTFALSPAELKSQTKGDTALSLVVWFAQWVAYFVHHGIVTSGVHNVLLGCNFWRGRLMREMFARSLRRRFRCDAAAAQSLMIRAFKIGETGCIGSLLTTPGDEQKWLRDDGFDLIQ